MSSGAPFCAIPTNSLNKTFSTFSRALKKDRYLESIEGASPDDAVVPALPQRRRVRSESCRVATFTTSQGAVTGSARLENHGRKERVPVDEYTIEHIMPQNEDLSEEWRGDLGPDWKRVHDTWLHTLGNLTLTGYNSEYSDHPFHKKRDMEGGFRDSPLRLNEGLGGLSTWNEEQIEERATRLSGQAVGVSGVARTACRRPCRVPAQDGEGKRPYPRGARPPVAGLLHAPRLPGASA